MTNKRVLKLQGSIQGIWKNLSIDLDKEPPGPSRDRLEAVHEMLQKGERPSVPDSEFAWDYALKLEQYFPDAVLPTVHE